MKQPKKHQQRENDYVPFGILLAGVSAVVLVMLVVSIIAGLLYFFFYTK